MGIDLNRLPPEMQRQAREKLGIRPPTRQKYHATRTWMDGVAFDSRKEADFCAGLKLLARAGEIDGYLYHGAILLTDGREGDAAVRYIPDFVIIRDGRAEIVDTKGFETPEFRLKMKLLRERYPRLEVQLR